MQYALLIHQNEKHFAALGEEEKGELYAEHGRLIEKLAEAGAMRGGEQLQPTRSATTVRQCDGELLLTDGPYAETTEQFGGFYLIEAENLDQAIEFAKELPSFVVEIRPLVETSEGES